MIVCATAGCTYGADYDFEWPNLEANTIRNIGLCNTCFDYIRSQPKKNQLEKIEMELCRLLDELIYLPIKEELKDSGIKHSLGFKKEQFKLIIHDQLEQLRELEQK